MLVCSHALKNVSGWIPKKQVPSVPREQAFSWYTFVVTLNVWPVTAGPIEKENTVSAMWASPLEWNGMDQSQNSRGHLQVPDRMRQWTGAIILSYAPTACDILQTPSFVLCLQSSGQSPSFRWRNGGPERGSDCSEVTQQAVEPGLASRFAGFLSPFPTSRESWGLRSLLWCLSRTFLRRTWSRVQRRQVQAPAVMSEPGLDLRVGGTLPGWLWGSCLLGPLSVTSICEAGTRPPPTLERCPEFEMS